MSLSALLCFSEAELIHCIPVPLLPRVLHVQGRYGEVYPLPQTGQPQILL